MKIDIKKRICILSVLIMTGCSIYEDRSQCPCLLTLDFSRNEEALLKDVDVRLYDANASSDVTGFTLGDDLTTTVLALPVPRSEILVSVCHPSGMMTSGTVTIPVGKDCPRVYMYVSRVRTYAEEVTDTVLLHKNHCVMNIITEGNRMQGYGLTVKGNVCGYGPDGTPLDGKFEYVPSWTGDGTCQVVLPRQKDSSLVIEIDDGTGVLKKFALGEYVSSVGYDWQSPDLQDINVYMDWNLTEISVDVEEWNSRQDHEIII